MPDPRRSPSPPVDHRLRELGLQLQRITALGQGGQAGPQGAQLGQRGDPGEGSRPAHGSGAWWPPSKTRRARTRTWWRSAAPRRRPAGPRGRRGEHPLGPHPVQEPVQQHRPGIPASYRGLPQPSRRHHTAGSTATRAREPAQRPRATRPARPPGWSSSVSSGSCPRGRSARLAPGPASLDPPRPVG